MARRLTNKRQQGPGASTDGANNWKAQCRRRRLARPWASRIHTILAPACLIRSTTDRLNSGRQEFDPETLAGSPRGGGTATKAETYRWKHLPPSMNSEKDEIAPQSWKPRSFWWFLIPAAVLLEYLLWKQTARSERRRLCRSDGMTNDQ